MQRAIVSLQEKTLQFSGADAAMHFPFDDIGLCYLDQPSIQQGDQGVMVKMVVKFRTPAQFMRPFPRCDSDVGHRGVGC